ncbi:outer membrane protein assembly factor BamB family protein [Halovenus sp. HT40]|uniref:outer membrane protein assembly factor BamB family protein n=1 Tax=Halovenus sp. HT40 TaxID=3126691 RepID=UPI00300F6DFF
MNRREVLGGIAAGLTAGLAGCGYAYGTGDIRERQSLTGRSLFGIETQDVLRDGDRILVAKQRDNTIRPSLPDEDPPDSEIDLSAFDLNGESQWEYSRAGTYTAATLAGAGAYLVDDGSRVEAVAPSGDDTEGEREWSAELPDAGPPIAGSPELVAVTTSGGVAAVSERLLWERVVDDLQDLFVVGRATVIHTANRLRVIDESGTETYHRTGDDLLVTTDAERLYLTDETEVWAVNPATGERLWEQPAEGLWTTLTVEGEVLGLRSTSEVRTFETTGAPLWNADISTSSGSFLPAAEWGYYVPGCELHGFSPNGQRWNRDLTLCSSGGFCGDCQQVDGWIDGELVWYLFESGDLICVQRTDQRRGLFW